MYTQLKKLATRTVALAAFLTLTTLVFWTESAFADSFVKTDQNFTFNCPAGEVYLVGDFDGQNGDDLICFTRKSGGDFAGNVYVALSSSDGSFTTSTRWLTSFCYGEEICQVGDFNGDGKDDIAAFVRSTKGNDGDGDVFVALSNGKGFAEARRWHDFFCFGQELCQVGDFNRDSLNDIVAFVRSSKSYEEEGDVWVSLSYGNGFLPASRWQDAICFGDEVCQVGDFSGDGLDDIVSFARSSPYSQEGLVTVAYSNGFTGFGSTSFLNPYFCIGEEICQVGDFNGDGVADLVGFVRSTKSDSGEGDVFITTTNPWNFWAPSVWHGDFCVGNDICQVGDFDGNGADEIVLFKFDSGSDAVTVETARIPPPQIHEFTNNGGTSLSWRVTCYVRCKLWVKKPNYDYLVSDVFDAGVIEGSHWIDSYGSDSTYQLHVEYVENRGTNDAYVDVVGIPRPIPQQLQEYRFKVWDDAGTLCYDSHILATDSSTARDRAQNECINCRVEQIEVSDPNPCPTP